MLAVLGHQSRPQTKVKHIPQLFTWLLFTCSLNCPFILQCLLLVNKRLKAAQHFKAPPDPTTHREFLALSRCINYQASTSLCPLLDYAEVKTRQAEGPVSIVPICGLEITAAVWAGHIPCTTSHVAQDWQLWTSTADRGNKPSVLNDGAHAVVQVVLFPLELSLDLIEKLGMSWEQMVLFHGTGMGINECTTAWRIDNTTS